MFYSITTRSFTNLVRIEKNSSYQGSLVVECACIIAENLQFKLLPPNPVADVSSSLTTAIFPARETQTQQQKQTSFEFLLYKWEKPFLWSTILCMWRYLLNSLIHTFLWLYISLMLTYSCLLALCFVSCWISTFCITTRTCFL